MIQNPKTFFEQIQNFIEESGLQLKKFKSNLSNYFTKAEAIDTFLGKTDQAESAKKADTATSATKATQDASGNVISSTYATKTEVTKGLAGKANASHTHTTAQVTGLDTALAGKAPMSHTHTIANVTGLDTALAGKAPMSHTHTVSQITDMPNVVLSVNDITPTSGGDVNLGLHAVATSGDYNDLRNKPTPPSSPDVYVTTQSRNDSSGYRVWSNGFIEQWGICRGTLYNITDNYGSNNLAVNVSLNKAFSTNTYQIYTTQSYYPGSAIDDYAVVYRPNTTTSKFTLLVVGNSPQYCYWYACGY